MCFLAFWAEPAIAPVNLPAVEGELRKSQLQFVVSKELQLTTKTILKPGCQLYRKRKNGKHIALIGGGPASLTVARDLLPLGYEITLFEKDHKSGGAMRTQIPRFRLPPEVLDEELNYILDMGVNCRFGKEITSLKAVLEEGYDAIFVGTGAPLGKTLELPGYEDCRSNIHTGIEWLASVAFGHITNIGKRVVVLGGGNTAMDCCRTAKTPGR